MPRVNILKYEISTASGDLFQSVQNILDEKVLCSQKEIDDNLNIPYFLLLGKSDESKERIYELLKDVVSKVVSDLGSEEKKETAVILGTSLVDANLLEAIHDVDVEKKSYTSTKKNIDYYAKRLSDELGLSDFTMSINTACTSSANALIEASSLVTCGAFRYAVVVGLEISSQMMSNGFYAMNLISATHQRPFDKSRDGLVLGEAIGALLISTDESPWSYMGGYSNCDSHNITSVSEDAHEYVQVITQALEAASIKSEDITALKAHATGTLSNDLSEINAISKLFPKDLKFCALKPYLGHTLGACGVVEMALFMGCIDRGFIPKTLSCEESILGGYVPLRETSTCRSGTFMMNYFGFGGSNTSLIIKKELS